MGLTGKFSFPGYICAEAKPNLDETKPLQSGEDKFRFPEITDVPYSELRNRKV